ncbi:hypothetical protein D777_03021 [Marinobacter nitratireducens]|uniref:Uncharacterized protein n=1 Tax=Marinobacter nitratireducens TaxID=1137280 RepID=A0A072N9X7_9GAMM|nr:hypothetical protein D777_03021 [Marinobacter nitratireducens]
MGEGIRKSGQRNAGSVGKVADIKAVGEKRPDYRTMTGFPDTLRLARVIFTI